MDKIRVGVVGVGALGRHHARVYATLPQATLVGVVDKAPGRAEEIAFPLGTVGYTDYGQLFGKVDAISIATPTTLHGEIGEQFLNEGVHVLVEKPVADSLEEADRLIRAASRNRKVLQVGHLERFNPAVRAVRPIVQRPRFIEAHRMAVTVRQLKPVYEEAVIKSALRMGLDVRTILKGLTGVEGRKRSAFHEYLDKVARDLR